MKTNVLARPKAVTHEGGTAAPRIKTLEQLERQVATCMLWENTFYESGEEIAAGIAESIKDAVASGNGSYVAALAIKARTDFKLRHVPLFVVRELCRHPAGRPFVADALEAVIRRPDEMAEFLALYWKGQKDPDKETLAASVKKGLARAFTKFSEYQLAKWNKDGAIKLRDVLFLCHAKPKDSEQEAVWKKLVDGTLSPPDTWEVALSAGEDKKGTWERLIRENKLGYMALLMNVRNMVEAGVDLNLVGQSLLERAKGSWALPFRFIAAAKHAPALAPVISDAMLRALEGAEKLPGKTAVLVDVSGSMDSALSGKSQMMRLEAASAMAILCREVMESARVFTFSNSMVEVGAFRGLPLADGIVRSQPHGGTNLAAALRSLIAMGWDRIVVVTDEQSHDGNEPFNGKGYIINVAPYKPGLMTGGGWHRINGWSERVIDWMRYEETGAIGQTEGDE
jgi:60 kDa SS-A/Ro ribonucleoprotein